MKRYQQQRPDTPDELVGILLIGSLRTNCPEDRPKVVGAEPAAGPDDSTSGGPVEAGGAVPTVPVLVVQLTPGTTAA
jgi:hypothetical protein